MQSVFFIDEFKMVWSFWGENEWGLWKWRMENGRNKMPQMIDFLRCPTTGIRGLFQFIYQFTDFYARSKIRTAVSLIESFVLLLSHAPLLLFEIYYFLPLHMFVKCLTTYHIKRNELIINLNAHFESSQCESCKWKMHVNKLIRSRAESEEEGRRNKW